ncbi:hypothetical protein BSK59_08465 [Paenibacillus odorifer]|uniref:BC1872 family protein n=1 Tax=Paenibacillus TaxID=44249 RepID=UPI00096BEB26|nr:hypothetical protein [Paenibacillus odorifer]OME58207.1 hypothetical protein BSK59_08465 [Paenibacillus odorifer]
MTLTREEILAMDPIELGPVVAEHVFKAKVIVKENFPELSLLIGWFGYEAWKPMKGTWHNAEWRNSEEKAWLDCPRFGEDISAAWEVEECIKELRVHTRYVACLKQVLVGTGEYVGMFDYIHATAEQRCKAALLAVLNL